MNGPCDCGAEDCPKCYPHAAKQAPERDEPEEPAPYRGSDPKNKWMDYICEGPRDAPY